MPNKPHPGQQSFTLIETVIAVALLSTIVLEAVGSMGNMVYFSNYSRRMTEGMWLAKRIMSQVEYHWSFRPFKELETEQQESKFAEIEEGPFTYKLSIKEWKFPLLDMIAGGGIGPQGEEGEEEEEVEDSGNSGGGGAPNIKQLLTQILGDHILKIAHVEVFWPEGAKRNSVELAMLLTNQREIDNQIVSRESVIKEMLQRVAQDRNPPTK